MKYKKIAVGVSAAAGLALILSGCMPGSGGGDAGTGGGGEGGDKLTISLAFTPASNWALETNDSFIISQLGCSETLTKYNAETNELEPLLATEWSQVDPTTWEFKLREGVTFQDGTEFNADAVKVALDHLLNVATPPSAFNPNVISGVEAVDPTTVHITTPTESALVPLRVAATFTGILGAAAYEGDQINIQDTCTGPYKVVSEVPTQSVSLEVNADYWGDAPSIAKVDAKFFPDGSTRATQVRTGESQASLNLPISSLTELEADSNLNVVQTVTPRTTGLYFNTAKAPFDNPEVRRAIQAAIDTEAIIGSIYDGVGSPAVGPFAPEYGWSPEGAEPATVDPEAAKQMLEDAGIAEGSLTVQLIAYTERPEFGNLAAIIQEQLGAIGVTVDIKASDYASVEPDLLNGNFDMSLLSRNQLGDIPDPAGYLTADYTCGGSYNISQFCDPAVDAAITAAIGTVDPEERYAAYADIAAQLQEDAVTVFIVHEALIAANRTSLEGFVNDPMGRYAVTTQLKFV